MGKVYKLHKNLPVRNPAASVFEGEIGIAKTGKSPGKVAAFREIAIKINEINKAAGDSLPAPQEKKLWNHEDSRALRLNANTEFLM